jgi:hypothetical protein
VEFMLALPEEPAKLPVANHLQRARVPAGRRSNCNWALPDRRRA